jgi:adenylosuccinate synthase
MLNKQVFIITDLGYGDAGKGTVVDWLTNKHNAHTVIRTGGPQALHRVVASDGREHVFSQFGSGTLRGAATHLSKHMLVAPSALLREGVVLQKKCKHNVFVKLSIHEDAILVTPIQAITGRIRELLRDDNRRGSVGVGVGETVRDSEDRPDLVLYARDLRSKDMAKKLTMLWKYKLSQYQQYVDRTSDLPESMRNAIQAELLSAKDPLLLQTTQEFLALKKQVRIVDDEYVEKLILRLSGTIIIEGSQGVLLDRFYGFYPYTTKVRATPETGKDILKTGHYDGLVTSLGVLRSYATRHGHGPFVTEDAELTKVLPDAANKTDPWQGNFRVGHFDAVSARYAATACGPGEIDGLVITCLDRTADLPTWSICTSYQYESTSLPEGNGGMMSATTNIFDAPETHIHRISEFLTRCQPVLRHHKKNKAAPWTKHTMQVMEIQHLIGIPVYAASVGETERDKRLVQQPVLNYL